MVVTGFEVKTCIFMERLHVDAEVHGVRLAGAIQDEKSEIADRIGDVDGLAGADQGDVVAALAG